MRFVQLYHTDWDHHGGAGADLDKGLDKVCLQVDRPIAALIRDLKQRGLLNETLVVWGGEFGRTPMGEVRDTVGRNHHIDAFTMWFAGGGTKPGRTIGKTDEIGFSPVEDVVHVHDIQATILHLLGIDHHPADLQVPRAGRPIDRRRRKGHHQAAGVALPALFHGYQPNPYSQTPLA